MPYTTIIIVASNIEIALNSETMKDMQKLLLRFPMGFLLLSNFQITYSPLVWLWYIAYLLFCTPVICYFFSKMEEHFQFADLERFIIVVWIL